MKKLLFVCVCAIVLSGCAKPQKPTAQLIEPTPDPYTILPAF